MGSKSSRPLRKPRDDKGKAPDQREQKETAKEIEEREKRVQQMAEFDKAVTKDLLDQTNCNYSLFF